MELSFIENLLKECPSTLVFTIVLLILSIFFYKFKNKDLPPGPWGLPLVGYWPYLGYRSAHLQLQKLMKKYGDIYTFKITGKMYIHLGSIKSIKEAHLTKSDCFMDRSIGFNTFTCFFQEGILGINGEQWKILRKFFIQMFKEYGLSSGKDMSSHISDSVNSIMQHLRATNGAPFDMIPILCEHFSTFLRRMLFNDNGITTEELSEILENYEKVLDVFFSKNILLAGNFAKYAILTFDPDFRDAIKYHKRMEEILRKIIKRHKVTLNEQSIRNFIDSYYKERNDRLRKSDRTGNYFTDAALVSSLLQFIGDGILGVAAYISFFVKALLEYPDEQEKIYKEIEDVLGLDRQPCLEDKNNLPYTNAFILEVTRTTDVLPLLPGLECTKETTLGGYRIPKGTVTLVNFWAAHHDPKVYEEPNVFKPSRFLKEAGKDKAENPVLFGVGKRSCIGETFVNMQVFLFISSIVKNFRLKLEEGTSNDLYFERKEKIIAYPRLHK